jgi:hypothetical protein
MGPETDPLLSTLKLLAVFIKMCNTTIGAEELTNISSYQTLSADKKSKIYKHLRVTA